MAKSAQGFGIFHKKFWAFGMGSCRGKSINQAIVSGAHQAVCVPRLLQGTILFLRVDSAGLRLKER